MKQVASSRAAGEYLLDGNVQVALVDSAHVHQDAAVKWVLSVNAPVGTYPITQATPIRMLLLQFSAVADVPRQSASSTGLRFTAQPKRRLWPDRLTFADIAWHGVRGIAR